MKNVRVKVREGCDSLFYDIRIYEGRKELMENFVNWRTEKVATRHAKAMAKRIGIKFDPEIIKQHGC